MKMRAQTGMVFASRLRTVALEGPPNRELNR